MADPFADLYTSAPVARVPAKDADPFADLYVSDQPNAPSATRAAVLEKAKANGFGDRVTDAREQAIRNEVKANDSWDAADALEGGIQRVKGNLARYGGEARKRAGIPMPEGYDNEAYVQEQRVRADAYREQAGFEQDWKNIDGPSKFGSYVAGQVLNSAPEIAATMLNPVAGGIGALASYGGSNLDAQIEEGGETDLLAATVAGAGQAALDRFVGVERAVGGAIKGAFKREGVRQVGGDFAKRVVVGAGGEGLQEGGQQTLEEAARYQVAADDYNVMDAAKRVGEAAVGGAIVGGAVNPILTKNEPTTATPSSDPNAAGTDPTVTAEADAKGDPLQITGPRAEPARLEDQRNWQREEKTTEPIAAGPPRGTPARPEVLDIFTGATPETLRPTSEGEVVRAVRGDLPLDTNVRQITMTVMDALNGGKARGKKATVLPVTDRVAAAYSALDALADKFAASPNIKPEMQESYLAALARAAEVVQAYELNLESLGVPRAAPAGPTVDQMAGPGVPIEKPGQINAAQAGFNSTIRPGEDIGQLTVDAKVAQQNAMAQQQNEMQRAQEMGMLEAALPQAEQLAQTVEEQQALQQEDNLRIQQEQLQPAQRQELLDSIIRGSKPNVTPLQSFLKGLKGIDPNAQPTPEELSALAQYSSMSYADKVAAAEKVKPEKLVEKAPQNKSLLEPVSVPAKMGKRQQRAMQARAEATALVPESQQPPEIKSMLKALEDAATSIDAMFKSLIKSPPIEGEQLSLFPEADPRVMGPKGLQQYIKNMVAPQDAKYEAQLAAVNAEIEKLKAVQPAPTPEPKQEALLDTKGKPTKAALRLTKDQVAEQVADMEKAIPNDGLGAAKKLAVVPEIKALIETAPGEAVIDLMSAVSRPDISMQDAVQLTQIVKDRFAPQPTPTTAVTGSIEQNNTAPEEEAESAMLDEENPGVNETPSFQRIEGSPAKRRVVKRALEMAVEKWTQGWTNPPAIEIFDPNNPPDTEIAKWFADNPFKGAYVPSRKTVYLNMDEMTPENFGPILYHESLGHYGLRELFGKAHRNVMLQIYRGNPEIRREASALMKRQGNIGGTTEDNIAYFTDEAVVSLYNGKNLDLSLSMWQKLKDMVTNFARRMGLPTSRKFTNADIIGILDEARRVVTTGNPGDRAPGFENQPSFMRTTPARQPIAQEIVDAFASSDALNKYMLSKGIVNPMARRVAITARDYMQRMRLVTMMGNTFADLARKLGLTDFDRLNNIASERDALVNEKRNQIESLIVEANRLPDRQELEDFMREYTLKAKHGFVPDFYTAEDKARVTVDPTAQAFVERFKTKHPEAHAMMLKMMQFAYDERVQYQKAIDDYINGEADEALKEKGLTQSEIADIQDRRKRQLKMFNDSVPKLDGPYFPLSRFGEHMVVAESPEFRALQAKDQRTAEENRQLEAMESDPTHYQVHFFDTKGQAELMRAEIAAQPEFSGAGARVTNAVKTEFFEQQGESPLLQMQKLRQMVLKDLPNTTFERETKRQIDTLLSDLYIRSLAETSARKFDTRRKNVAGSSTEMLRSFHDKMKADAASRAHVTTFAQEMAITKTLYDQINQNPTDPQYEARRDFLRELQARHAQSIRLDLKNNQLQNKIMLASSVYYLFTMPRYYIQNMMQPGVYTLPQLAARHTPMKAASTMVDVYKSVKNIVTDRTKWTGEIDPAKLSLPADEVAFLETAQKRGKLDFGQQLDFGEIDRSATQAGRGIRKATHIMRRVSGQIEYLNRTVAGVSAYRLEKARGASAEAATEYALRVIDDTQLNYSTGAQSRAFNMLPKVMTQFRKYQVGMIALQYGMIRNAAKQLRREGLSAPETKEALQALAYSWTTIGAIAGAAGLPGMQVAAVMGAYLFGDDDEPLNGERWLRGKFSDDEMGLALRKGLPALMGVDMGNVGLGTLLNPLPFFDYSKLGDTGGGAQMLGSLAGPAAGIVTGIAEKAYQGGFMAGAEQALPSGVRAAIKGYTMATEGLERKNGDIVMTPDEIGTMKSVLQALGFRDLDAAEKMTRYYETVAAEEYYRERVSDLKRDYLEARKANNADAMQNVMSEWRAMNVAKRRFDLKPTAISELYKARQQQVERVKKFRERAGIE